MQQALKPGGSGFTLLETLIVLTILSIVAIIALPTFSSHEDEQKLSGAVKELVTALRFARIDTIHSGENRRVKIDKSSNSFEVINATTPTETIYHPTSKKPYFYKYDDSIMYRGVDISGAGIIDITFGINGLADNNSLVTLTYGSSSVDVNVDTATGYVLVN